MSNRAYAGAGLFAALLLLPAAPANAAAISITHAKALAGNVTPGDTPGYPVTLNAPGSFQVDSNLFVAANKIGIQVAKDNVTIDLNGFTLQGSNVAWYGITGAGDGVVIKNGGIDDFKFDGIRGTGDDWTIVGIRVVENGRDGISAGGSRWAIESTQVLDNAAYGLSLGGGFHFRVHNNTVANNGGTGIRCQSCVISGNLVVGNGDFGIDAGGATVVGNHINGNTSTGLYAGVVGTGFAHNTLYDNSDGAAGNQVVGALPLHPNICVNVAC